MLRLKNHTISKSTRAQLDMLQAKIDAGSSFINRIDLAKSWWDKKSDTKARAAAIVEIRASLAAMCFGSVRCAYCQDSAADEIEHIWPKTIFPSKTFSWNNYCFACGPCNGPKNNKYGIISANGKFLEITKDKISDEPTELPALIDPRTEDPGQFLELDIGGTTPNGYIINGTLNFLIRENLNPIEYERAKWTIAVLNLNREIVRKSRESAYHSYRASLTEYATARSAGEPPEILDKLREGIISMPHPTVLNELIKQSSSQPIVKMAIDRAPEINTWLR